MNMKNNLAAIFAVFLLTAASGVVHATILTFNGTAGNGAAAFAALGSTYSESGYTMEVVSSTVFFIDNDFDSELNAFDDDVVEFNNNSGAVRFTLDGGGLFNALSVVIGSVNSLGNFLFTGNLQGGGIVTQTLFPTLGGHDLKTLLGFTNLISLDVTSLNDGTFPVFDDLQLQASNNIPEPVTLALISIGLAGLGFRRKTT